MDESATLPGPSAKRARKTGERLAYPSRVVWPLVLGSALNALNSLMIATAIPIARDLGVGTSSAISLVSVLYVSSAVAQPVFGVLADQFGARAAFISGMALTTAGGLVGGLGVSLAALLVARVLIGVGTVATYPSAMAGLRDRQAATGHPVPPRILGRVAVAVQVAGAVGMPLGGL